MFYGAKPYLFQHATELRDNSTAAEKLLWARLRNKKLGVKFRRQHTISEFIVDFYCHPLRFAVEIDGGYHLKRDQKEYDRYRTDDLSDLGITIIRFTNDQVENKIEEVLKEIGLQIAHRIPNP